MDHSKNAPLPVLLEAVICIAILSLINSLFSLFFFWSSWLFSIFIVSWLSILCLYVSICLCLRIQYTNTRDSIFIPYCIISNFLLYESSLSSLFSVLGQASCLSHLWFETLYLKAKRFFCYVYSKALPRAFSLFLLPIWKKR